MFKNYTQFINESASSNNWVIAPYMKFIWECNNILVKATDGKYTIIRDEGPKDKDIIMSTGGSQSLIHCLDPEGRPFRSGDLKPGEYWSVERMIDHGWFGLSITPKDRELSTWFSVYYELKGTKFVPVNYNDSGKIKTTTLSQNERLDLKGILGEDEYLAQTSLKKSKLPRGESPKKAAQEWLDILKKLPELDLYEYRTKIMSNKYDI